MKAIQNYIDTRTKIDSFIFISDMMIENPKDLNSNSGYYGSGCEATFSQALGEYQNKVNPQAKIFAMDLTGYNKNLNAGKEMKENSMVKIFGTSDNILKFISLRGMVSQVEAVKVFASEYLAK